jgi:hypothetical protein
MVEHCSGDSWGLMMIAHSLALLFGYLGFGVVVYLLARRDWPDEWDEALLASVLGPALLGLLATAAAATLVWGQFRWLAGGRRGKRPQ